MIFPTCINIINITKYGSHNKNLLISYTTISFHFFRIHKLDIVLKMKFFSVRTKMQNIEYENRHLSLYNIAFSNYDVIDRMSLLASVVMC